jgi:hypothetical protein
MTRDPDDVVRVYSGPLVDVEAYQQVLTEAGIESKVVGTDLGASFGSALQNSIELWVHQGDLEKAVAAVKEHDEEKARRHHPGHGHPPGGA